MTHRRRQVAVIGGALGAALLLLCALGAGVALSGQRPALRTHEDTVVYALERRGVAYRRVAFAQNFEESVDFDAYRAQVQVHLPDGQVASGWIGCEDRDRTCFLELRSLGIRGEALPDIDGDPPLWRAWADRALAALRSWLH